ncbi:MAG: YgiQ family radical SAM protein [Oscillospiraceae bacterium]|nr:YgiQ family radical SAM protein [Oscillospiraceae bacterium]
MPFLPLTKEEALSRGWGGVDIACVTGDSYVDHPSFGIAIISRVLEDMGLRVGIIAQPQKDADYSVFGKPRLGFFVTGGNIDSMVAHYTAAKRKRSDDPYTAGNKAGNRPDRAVTAYCRAIRRVYPDTAVIIGGLEASLRRFAHYDYWGDEVRPSVLLESGADLLVFGMGELQTRMIASRLSGGEHIRSVTDVRGTCYLCGGAELPKNSVSCPSYKKVREDKAAFARAHALQAAEQDYITGRAIVQKHGEDLYLIQNPPMHPLTTAELDAVYALPFMRMYHPSYEPLGGVKAIEEVEFSVTHNRGCFGGCAFCSIAFHQGKYVSVRSKESILREAITMTGNPRFKGYIHDVGGATANFRRPSCKGQAVKGMCRGRRCLTPSPCPNLEVSHSEYLDILRELRRLPKVKKVFVRSGLRYDYISLDPDPAFLRELAEHHISGRLKVAPEHICGAVLDCMGKPRIQIYEKFAAAFRKATEKAGKKQYLVPYLMSSHPGTELKHAAELASYLQKHGIRPEQVQDFYPTPGTDSTAMFHTGLDPYTMKPVYTAKSQEEKAKQRALLQPSDPNNRALAHKAIREYGQKSSSQAKSKAAKRKNKRRGG